MFENYQYVKKNLSEFKENPFGRTEGTFTNFDSLDDQIDGFHYFLNTSDRCKSRQENIARVP